MYLCKCKILFVFSFSMLFCFQIIIKIMRIVFYYLISGNYKFLYIEDLNNNFSPLISFHYDRETEKAKEANAEKMAEKQREATLAVSINSHI